MSAPVFIQWKGTALCADVTCPGCGATYHVCGERFFYSFTCGACGKSYELGSHVTLTEVSECEGPTLRE